MKRSREPDELLDPESADNHQRVSGFDNSRPSAAKIFGIDSSSEDYSSDDDGNGTGNSRKPTSVAMKCSLPPHRDVLTFKSYVEYESHYSAVHSNRCLDCRKNFPSDHLLGIHIEECHDPLVIIRRDKGEHTYSCFVEGCERKCMTSQKRRMHMIDKHLYPKNFFFAVTRDGIDGRSSLLTDHGHHRRRSSTTAHAKEARRRASTLDGATSQAKDAETQGTEKSKSKKEDVPDTDMSELTGAMSAMQFVPQSVRFGRGRAGFAKS